MHLNVEAVGHFVVLQGKEAVSGGLALRSRGIGGCQDQEDPPDPRTLSARTAPGPRRSHPPVISAPRPFQKQAVGNHQQIQG